MSATALGRSLGQRHHDLCAEFFDYQFPGIPYCSKSCIFNGSQNTCTLKKAFRRGTYRG